MHKLTHRLIKQLIDKNPDLHWVKLQHANICIVLDVDLNTDSISIFFNREHSLRIIQVQNSSSSSFLMIWMDGLWQESHYLC